MGCLGAIAGAAWNLDKLLWDTGNDHPKAGSWITAYWCVQFLLCIPVIFSPGQFNLLFGLVSGLIGVGMAIPLVQTWKQTAGFKNWDGVSNPSMTFTRHIGSRTMAVVLFITLFYLMLVGLVAGGVEKAARSAQQNYE